MRYLLDTNTCIYIIKHRPSSVQEKLAAVTVGEVGVSNIVLAELWYGIAHSRKKKHNEHALTEFLDYVEVLDWPREAAPAYGRVRSLLRERGTPIGAMDLLIAAHALTIDAALVTDNVLEFRRVPKLKIEIGFAAESKRREVHSRSRPIHEASGRWAVPRMRTLNRPRRRVCGSSTKGLMT